MYLQIINSIARAKMLVNNILNKFKIFNFVSFKHKNVLKRII